MRILIEEYQYDVSAVKEILYGIDPLTNIEGKVSIQYVGYFYNTLLKDCVFILPKVLLKGGENEDDGPELAFGKYRPEDIINVDICEISQEHRDFIYEFAVWIYRAIVVFKNSSKETDIVYHSLIAELGKGKRRVSNTFLDILLSLIQFNKDNQNFFFFILKNQHSGFNKINWTRTIAHSPAFVQADEPVYLRPENKKRRINFDEELLVIFFSILNYIGDKYGFKKDINIQFDLIKGKQFETYLKGYGKTRLLQIKYKYFSDKALELWNLCYAFFERAKHILINTEQKEYLLVKNFYIVFEAIIDELVGDNPLPDGMDKKQDDGKIVDHLYTAKSLIEQENRNTYYIGDSKYYKIGHALTEESVYKQYTYARNVIQKNLDLFNSGKVPSGIHLRDDVTEGYDIVPNFFISATMSENLNYSEPNLTATDRAKKKHKKVHFENRLFDRDTLLLYHYDVNFLFVLSLYARNNTAQKAAWKAKIRKRFTNEIRNWLQEDFDFFAMTARPGVNAEEFIKSNFKMVLGKIYQPYDNPKYFSLALEKTFEQENSEVKNDLGKYFIIEKISLGESPEAKLSTALEEAKFKLPLADKSGVLMVMMENYEVRSKNFISSGRIAIALRIYNKGYLEIVEHLNDLSYILYHHRSIAGQHLFKIISCRIASESEIGDTYKNIHPKGDNNMYVLVEFSPDEYDVSAIDSSQVAFSKEMRYDAQYVIMEELKR